ncbi:MAG: BASS family bile acid:Na+ symporter [Saprospiraceae bacterium]|jgi:BASS family bile acid:Na+ symporter
MQELDNVQLNFDNSTLMIMNICLGFVMFGVALGLSLEDFKRLAKMPKLVLVGFLSQFFVLPLVTFLFVLIVKPIPSVALGLFMIAACPGGNISNFISSLAKANVALSVTLTAIASTIAAFLVPVNFTFWASLYPETELLLKKVNVPFWELLGTVVMILGVPLILGLLFRYKLPNFTKKLIKPIQRLSLVIFAIFIVFALLKNGQYFIEYIGVIFIMVFAHNALALITGYSLGQLFGFSTADKRTLAIETGIQNAGLGLVIIFNFFEELGGMAVIAAWWGIWDMIAGLLLGYFWSRRKP